MHPFWKIPDVVSEVVSLLPKPDQARMAQVNTSFWEIAIPKIWRDVPDVEHFFNLFPSDLWNKTREPLTSPPQLNRERQDSDWTRFLSHSSSTRTTRYTQGRLRNVVPHQIWSHYLLSASFPNLKLLVVTAFEPLDEDFSDIIPLLLRSSLRSIAFIIQSPIADSFLIHTLRAVEEKKTLSVEEMDFCFFWAVGPSLGEIAEAIASQTNLRRLRFSGESDIAYLVGCAKDLPFLEELEVLGTYADVPEIDYHNTYLRSLTTFTIVGRPALIHSFIRAVRSKRLARLELTFRYSESTEMSSEPLAELQRFRPHLAHLKLDVSGPFAWEDLIPVLNLTELQTFQLHYSPWNDSGGITDGCFKQMVDAWPNLTQLEVDASFTHITLTSLAYLATQRPNLIEMALTFKAGGAMNKSFSRDASEHSRFTHNALEVFDVRESTFDEGDEEGVAKLFRCWWPKARLCQTDLNDWDSDCAPKWPRPIINIDSSTSLMG